eukprot:gene4198-4891_t
MNVQPRSCARRRISKMREGLAAAGWTCRVAVVCMVLPRSVVKELGKYQPLDLKAEIAAMEGEGLKQFTDIVGLFADIFTIGASAIAIYLFVFKRDAIASVFSLLLNYSYQLSLTELKEKLDRINEAG